MKIHFSEDLRSAIGTNYDKKRREVHGRYGSTGLSVLPNGGISSNGTRITTLEDLHELITDLQLLEKAIEEETGIQFY